MTADRNVATKRWLLNGLALGFVLWLGGASPAAFAFDPIEVKSKECTASECRSVKIYPLDPGKEAAQIDRVLAEEVFPEVTKNGRLDPKALDAIIVNEAVKVQPEGRIEPADMWIDPNPETATKESFREFLVRGLAQSDVPVAERKMNAVFTVIRAVSAGTVSYLISLNQGATPATALLAGMVFVGSHAVMLQWGIDVYYKKWTSTFTSRMEKLRASGGFTYGSRRLMRFSWALVVTGAITTIYNMGGLEPVSNDVLRNVLVTSMFANVFTNDFFEANRMAKWISNKAMNFWVGQFVLAATAFDILYNKVGFITAHLGFDILFTAGITATAAMLVVGSREAVAELGRYVGRVIAPFRNRCFNLGFRFAM